MNTLTLAGQPYTLAYLITGKTVILPDPAYGRVAYGDYIYPNALRICVWNNGDRWASWADGRSLSLTVRYANGTWERWDSLGAKTTDTDPPEERIVKAVEATLPQILQGVDEFAAPKPPAPPPDFRLEAEPLEKKSTPEVICWEAPNLKGVSKATFDLTPSVKAPEALIPLDLSTPQEPRVNARELYAFLKIGKVFGAWITERIEIVGFVENQDFTVCFPNLESKRRGGHNAKEYLLTLDMAKELSMLERNEKGKQARRYFIECEKQLRGRPALTLEDACRAVLVVSEAKRKAEQQVLTLTNDVVEKDRQVDALQDKITIPSKSILTEEFAKLYGNLLGFGETQLFMFLFRHEILFRGKRGVVPYAKTDTNKHFDVSEEEFDNPKTGGKEKRQVTRWTPEGVIWLRNYLLKHPDALLSQLLVTPGTRDVYKKLRGHKLTHDPACNLQGVQEGWICYGALGDQAWMRCATRRNGEVVVASGPDLTRALKDLATRLPAKKKTPKLKSDE